MAKKKSKTQKLKKNIKRKNNRTKASTNIQNQKSTKKVEQTNIKKQNSQNSNEKRKIVPKDQVEYKLFTQSKQETKKQKTNPLNDIKIKTKNLLSKENKQKKNNIKIKKDEKLKIKNKQVSKDKKQSKNINKKSNIFIRLLNDLIKNLHIIFNTIIIIVFLVILLGLKQVEVFETSFILYVGGILLFLILIAISYNKYISGRIFTIILCILMSLGIYRLQYTYDFIRNLNSSMYEYKEYHVVSFDNSSNKNIYNINNKKVGLLKENSVNIERVLNTKLDQVKYITFDSQTELFDSFYNNEFRAIIVTENQYKYLKNNKIKPETDVKILYTFKANALK